MGGRRRAACRSNEREKIDYRSFRVCVCLEFLSSEMESGFPLEFFFSSLFDFSPLSSLCLHHLPLPSSFLFSSTSFKTAATMALTVRASARPVLAMASAAPKAAKPISKAPKVRRGEEMRAL